jgi:hypothetical protein
MEYSLSHDGIGRIKVEVDGKFTTLPYMEGLSIRHAAYEFLSQYGIAWEDVKPVEISDIPDFPEKLTVPTSVEKHTGSKS